MEKSTRRVLEDLRLDIVERANRHMEIHQTQMDKYEGEGTKAFLHYALECADICKMIDTVLLKLREEERENDDF